MNNLKARCIYFLGLSLILAFTSVSLFGQSDALNKLKEKQLSLLDCNESVREALYDITTSYMEKGLFDSARIYLQRQDRYRKNCPDAKNDFFFYFCTGFSYFSQSNFDSAFVNFEKALSYAEKGHDLKEQIRVHNLLGGLYAQRSNLRKAKEHSLQSIELSLDSKDAKGVAHGNLSLGLLYLQTNESSKAVACFLKTDSIISESGEDDPYLIVVNLNLGKIFFAEKSYEKSKKYYSRVLTISERLGVEKGAMLATIKLAELKVIEKNYIGARQDFIDLEPYYLKHKDTTSLALINLNIGHTYFETNDFLSSEKYYVKSNSLSAKINDSLSHREGLLRLGEVYFKTAQYNRCNSVLLEAQKIRPAEMDKSPRILWLLAQSFNKLSNPTKAFEYLNQYKTLQDSLDTKKNIAQLQELETKYETEKKQLQIQSLEKENTLVKQRRWLLVGLTALLFLIPILFLYQRSKKRKKIYQGELAKMQLASLKSQMSPHFMFNSINSIKGMMINDTAEAAADQLAKFSKFMRNILNYSGDEFISLQEEVDFLRQYVHLENFKREFSVAVNFEDNANLANEQIEVLPFLIQPFLENSFKHAFTRDTINPTIDIKFTKSGDWLYITIEDNGIGSKRNKGTEHVSKGTALVKNRLALHNESNDNVNVDYRGEWKGTQVTLKLKV